MVWFAFCTICGCVIAFCASGVAFITKMSSLITKITSWARVITVSSIMNHISNYYKTFIASTCFTRSTISTHIIAWSTFAITSNTHWPRISFSITRSACCLTSITRSSHHKIVVARIALSIGASKTSQAYFCTRLAYFVRKWNISCIISCRACSEASLIEIYVSGFASLAWTRIACTLSAPCMACRT